MLKEEKIIFHSDYYYESESGVVIICAPTGVLCTVQAGGKACNHPKVEGFSLPIKLIKNPVQDLIIDDCKWGCWGGEKDDSDGYDDDHLKKYASEIDKFLDGWVNYNNYAYLNFKFDHERIKELMEGWWPVIIRFPKSDEYVIHSNRELLEKTFKGFIHLGNCDYGI